MKDYYVFLDYTNSTILTKKIPINNCSRVYLTCNDEGGFCGYLKDPKSCLDSLDSEESFFFSYLKLEDYEQANLGNVLNYNKLKEIDRTGVFGDLCSFFEIDDKDSILSLETLNLYFLETLEEFEGYVFDSNIIQTSNYKVPLFLIKIHLDEEILKKITKNKKTEHIKRNKSFVDDDVFYNKVKSEIDKWPDWKKEDYQEAFINKSNNFY